MKRIVAALFAVSVFAANAQAAELSALSGLYKSNKVKNGLETTNISLGARYGAEVVDGKSWFADVNVNNTSYKVKAGKAPDADSIYSLGGGMAYWMKSLSSDNFTPYLAIAAHLESGKYTNAAGAQVETTGVSYQSDVGVRINTSDKCFINLETNLFKSYLTKTDKEKTTTAAGTTTTETTSMELFGDTNGAFATMTVGLGMKI